MEIASFSQFESAISQELQRFENAAEDLFRLPQPPISDQGKKLCSRFQDLAKQEIEMARRLAQINLHACQQVFELGANAAAIDLLRSALALMRAKLDIQLSRLRFEQQIMSSLLKQAEANFQAAIIRLAKSN